MIGNWYNSGFEWLISEEWRFEYYDAGLPDWVINHKLGNLKNYFVPKKMKFAMVTNWATWPVKNWKLGSFVWNRSAEILFHHAVLLRLQEPFLLKNQPKLEIHNCNINICESTLVASIEKIWYPYFFLFFM